MNSKTKMKYTSQKGITLIALVITIIVLLILAGVTINMVLGDNGIIAQAQKGKEAHEDASKTDENTITTALGKMDQYTEGTLANLAKKGEIEVGDYVNYSYTAGNYTATVAETGSTSDQPFNSGDDGNVKITNWRVLSTDNGVIELIGVLPEEAQELAKQDFPAIDSSKKLTLDGESGFINAPTLLNEMCKTLYSGDLGTARSINVDDILEITRYDKTRYYTNGGGVSTAATENQKTLGDLEGDATLGLSLSGDIAVPGGQKKEELEVNYRQILQGWTKDNFEDSADPEKQKIYEMLFKYSSPGGYDNDLGATYWIASTCNQIDFKNQIIKYRVYIGNAWGLGGQWLYTSDGNSRGETEEEIVHPFILRPIVTLKSGLTIDDSVEGKNGDTPATAWVIK